MLKKLFSILAVFFLILLFDTSHAFAETKLTDGQLFFTFDGEFNFSGGPDGGFFSVSPFTIDLEKEKITGTASVSDSTETSSFTISGPFDKSAYSFEALIEGTSRTDYGGVMGGYDWGEGFITTTYTGTLKGTYDAAETDPSWKGSIEITYTGSSSDFSNFNGVHAGDPPTEGTKRQGEFTLTGKGTLPKLQDQEKIEIRVKKITGDAVYYRKGEDTERNLTVDTILNEGDNIVTSPNSSVEVQIGDLGSLIIAPFSYLKFDKYVLTGDLKKIQMHLYVGAVRPILKHKASIRSDFSVTTPTASSSIRGSEMIVSYNEDEKITTVYVTEDKAYVQGIEDENEQEVSEGYKVTVDESGKQSEATTYSQDELPEELRKSEIPSWIMWLVGFVILATLIGGVILWKKKRSQKPLDKEVQKKESPEVHKKD